MIPRYSRPEMVAIWSPETRFRIWYEIEAHACDAQAALGVIPKANAEAVWRVKDVEFNVVRIDEIGSKSRKVEGSFLVDLDAKTMKFLNHDRKLYGDQNTPAAPVIKGTCTVKKGQNVKNLQGFKCVEYIVTNNEENTQITYYIADGKFSFFEKLLRQLNRKEKSARFSGKSSFWRYSRFTERPCSLFLRLRSGC